MSQINIAGAIDELLIYDDPEYCESREKSCGYCHGLGYCELFRTQLEEKNSLEIKCDQCKAAYQKSILNKSPLKSKQNGSLKNHKPEH
jgi:hypothetical protein